MSKPVIALVGRPNVGKSTLFNRLAGQRLAVVDDTPGTTRDRLHAEAEWGGVDFTVVDTGGIDPREVKQGTGKEPLSIGSAEFIREIRFQAEAAIREADAVVFLVDAVSGVTPADYEVADILRRHQREKNGQRFPPVLVAVNKADDKNKREQALQFYELGFENLFAISALHGSGTGDMLEGLIGMLQHHEEPEGEADEGDGVRIAIVGKPNVGKSSLLNRLLGEERAIVSEIAGTTRDAVDSYIQYEGTDITLIDTAGIRRRGKIDPGVEKYSVIRTLRAIERSDVALLMLDAVEGITAQDAHIAGFILDAWKSVVVLVNKWDAIEKDTFTIEKYKKAIQQDLKFLDYVPTLYISALTGQRANQVLPLALKVQEERMVRLSTSSVNKMLRKAQDMHPAPTKSGRRLKILYGTQAGNAPPTFVMHVNDPKLVHFSYKRFLENRIREEYAFSGTPIRLVFRARSE